jgi:chromate reductase, NAD(P)H dehydrogenase (quinone)
MVTKMGPNMAKFNVAIVVGSNRRESLNRKLAHALVNLVDGNLLVKFVHIDDLPMYNQDLETPLPASVARFKTEIEQADGLLFVTPEHNRSIPALLKNAIDWGARPYGRNSWAGKPVAISGTSPGAIGTAVAQQHLRQILGDLGALVMGGEAYVAFRPGLIDEANDITDERTRQFLHGFVDRFATLVARLNGHETSARAA